MESWGEDLAGLTGEEMANGIKNLPKDWPPTPREFRELCLKTKNKKVEHLGYAERIEFEKPRNKKLAKRHCNKMRRILQGRQANKSQGENNV